MMKKVKNRPMTVLLRRQLVIQEQRLSLCAIRALSAISRLHPTDVGSFYSPTIRSKYFNSYQGVSEIQISASAKSIELAPVYEMCLKDLGRQEAELRKHMNDYLRANNLMIGYEI